MDTNDLMGYVKVLTTVQQVITYFYENQNIINGLLDDFVDHRDYDKTQLKLAMHITFISFAMSAGKFPDIEEELVEKLTLNQTATDWKLRELHDYFCEKIHDSIQDDPNIPKNLKNICLEQVGKLVDMVENLMDQKFLEAPTHNGAGGDEDQGEENSDLLKINI